MPRGRLRVTQEQATRAEALRHRLRAASIGMDMERLARSADLPRRTVDNYFAGESRSPSFFLIAGLASALALSLDDLARESAEH